MNSIKTKILLVVAASLLVGGVVLALLFDHGYRQNLQWRSDQAMRSSEAAFENLRQDSTRMMSASVEALVTNDEINTALAARDRDKLLAITAPLYKQYHARYGITHWNYWEPEQEGQQGVKGLRNFLRTATPDKYGEYLERVTLARVVEKKTFVDGLDLGNTGFALRVVHPVYHAGRLAGYFELGMDISSFLESMKRQVGNDYGLMLVKQRLDQKKWASSRTSRGLTDNWNDMPNLVLAKNTSKDDGMLAYSGDVSGIADQGENLGLVEKKDNVYTRAAFPLTDASGAKVGGVFVLTDITGVYQEAHRAQIRALMVIAGLMVLMGGLMCLLFQKLIVRRLENLIRVATRVVGGEFQTAVVASSHDEIGRFEELFEQFRQVFVGLVEEVERRSESAPAASGAEAQAQADREQAKQPEEVPELTFS